MAESKFLYHQIDTTKWKIYVQSVMKLNFTKYTDFGPLIPDSNKTFRASKATKTNGWVGVPVSTSLGARAGGPVHSRAPSKLTLKMNPNSSIFQFRFRCLTQ